MVFPEVDLEAVEEGAGNVMHSSNYFYLLFFILFVILILLLEGYCIRIK